MDRLDPVLRPPFGRSARCPNGHDRGAGRAVVALALLGGAWWVVSLPPFSAPATAAVVVSGVGAAAWGARRRPPVRPPRRLAGVGLWAALAMVAGAWELAAYLQHPRVDHPTLSWLANGLLDSHPARAVAFVVWLLGSRELGRR